MQPLRRFSPLLCLVALACSGARNRCVEPTDTTKTSSLVDVRLPPLADDVVFRAFILGDAGEQGPIRDAVNEALASRIRASRAPSAVLMPGDLFYPAGLPDGCRAARERIEREYTSRFPNERFVSAPGNHDHGNLRSESDRVAIQRIAHFDCERQRSIPAALAWTGAASCECLDGWSFPSAGALTGVEDLGPLTLVTYDSQEALSRPLDVARALSDAIDHVPDGRRVIVMAHHPLDSVGAHNRAEFRSPQDLRSPEYRAYIAAVRPVFEARAPQIALLVYGHDHSLQYFPEAVPASLVSGAGAKATPVSGSPPGGYAVGDGPGLAELDVHEDGRIDLWLLSRQPPKAFTIAAR